MAEHAEYAAIRAEERPAGLDPLRDKDAGEKLAKGIRHPPAMNYKATVVDESPEASPKRTKRHAASLGEESKTGDEAEVRTEPVK